MNTKSLLLDYGIPVLTVVGAAVVTYLLTGGEEEYPSEFSINQQSLEPPEEHDGDKVLNDALISLEEQSNDFDKLTLEIKTQLSLVQQHQTNGFQDINDKLDSIMKELHSIKVSVQVAAIKQPTDVFHDNNDKTQSVATGNGAAVARSLSMWTQLVHQAVAHFALDITLSDEDMDTCSKDSQSRTCLLVDEELTRCSRSCASSIADPGEVSSQKLTADGCDILLMYINNLINSSSVPRYRKLSTSNSAHKNTLSRLNGHGGVLRAMGFAQKDKAAAYEWQWTPERIKLQHTGNTASDGSAPQVPSSEEEALSLLRETARLLEMLKTDRMSVLKTARETLSQSTGGDPTIVENFVPALPSLVPAPRLADGFPTDALRDGDVAPTIQIQTPVLASFDQIFSQVKSSKEQQKTAESSEQMESSEL